MCTLYTDYLLVKLFFGKRIKKVGERIESKSFEITENNQLTINIYHKSINIYCKTIKIYCKTIKIVYNINIGGIYGNL